MRPVSQPFLQISTGNFPCSSISPATGMISLRANSRAVSLSCFSSSENSKLGMRPIIGATGLLPRLGFGLPADPALLALGGLALLEPEGVAGRAGSHHEADDDPQQ